MIEKKRFYYYWGILVLLLFTLINLDAKAASDGSVIGHKHLNNISVTLLNDGTLNIEGEGKVTEKNIFPDRIL